MPLLDPAVGYFLAIYDTGSVNAAARRMFVANSAVSRQISRLERELSTVLFDRLSTGMVPTEAGKAFAAYARRILADTDGIEAELHSRAVTRAKISVAAVDGVVHSLLPQVCASYHRAYPESQIRLVRAAPAQVSGLVRDGSVDVGVTYNISLATDVVVRFSQEATLQAVMSKDHPLSTLGSVSVRQIAQYPLALSLPTSTSRALIEAYASTHLIPIEPIFEIDDPAAVIEFVAATDAVTVLNPLTISANDRERVGVVPIREPELRQRTLQVQCHARRSISPALEAFIDSLVTTISARADPTSHAGFMSAADRPSTHP